MKKTIIDTLTAAGNFKTLLTVLKTASFMDTLRTPGPYTLFAPTDEVFERMTASQLKMLLKDIRRLKTIVTYHVISGVVATKDVKPGELRTVEGNSLEADVNGGQVSMNGAKVVQGDIAASNGLIHAIDALLLPKSLRLAAVA
jgi:uncharacterized surface protein with fasciclin (FAS1) repeats